MPRNLSRITRSALATCRSQNGQFDGQNSGERDLPHVPGGAQAGRPHPVSERAPGMRFMLRPVAGDTQQEVPTVSRGVRD